MPGKEDDNPFAVLKGLRDSLPSGGPPKPDPSAEKSEASRSDLPDGPARAVVRIERKGRGGKEATIVEKLELKPKALEAWLKELKRELGCGGQIEEDAIVLQGDQRTRIEPLLEKRGVKKIIRG